MAARVYLHIGLPKSGTTFLQTRMWNNRPLLRAQGFLYPGRDRMDHFHATQVIRGVSNLKPENADAWDRLVTRVRAWDGAALISHEFFCIASAEQAQRAVQELGADSVVLVVTARDYVRQFSAVWQEALKMGTAGSLDAFIGSVLRANETGSWREDVEPDRPWGWPSQDLPAILSRWSAAVPPDRINLITVPPASAPRNLLWERWCRVVGIDDSGFEFEGARSNESLGAAQAALLERVVPHLTAELSDQGWVRHRWLRQYFGHEVLAAQGGERFALRRDHADKLRELARQAVQDIAEPGYRVIGDLQDLVPAADLPGRTPDDVPAEEVADVAAQAIEQMIRDVMTKTYEARRWRREAQRLADSIEQTREAVKGPSDGRRRGVGVRALRRARARLAGVVDRSRESASP